VSSTTEAVAVATCEMCGAVKAGAASGSEIHDARGAICGLADLHDDHPLAVQVILVRVLHPRASWDYVAEKLQRTRVTLRSHCQRLAAVRPDLRAAMGMRSVSQSATPLRYSADPGTTSGSRTLVSSHAPNVA
jgi:hypothetical protein